MPLRFGVMKNTRDNASHEAGRNNVTMKCYQGFSVRRLVSIAILLALPVPITASWAENFTTSVQVNATQTWDDAIWEPGFVTATSGNTYEVLGGSVIWNPPLGFLETFTGDSLTLDPGSRLVIAGPVNKFLNFRGVDGNPGLILDGGWLRTEQETSNQVYIITGSISVTSGSVSFIHNHPGIGGIAIWAHLSGNGKLALINGSLSNPLDIESVNNPYGGQWTVISGYLRGVGVGSLGTGNITVAAGAVFEVDYDIQTPGTLRLLGNNSVMVLHQNCQFSAVSINGVTLAPGTYTYNNLLAQFPGNFAAGGSGSITVISVAAASVPPPVTLPGYYVDYVGGSDSNVGTDPASAWQHCPGDPSAIGNAAATSLNPGDTVFFKGGVSYALAATNPPVDGIALNWSGTAENPITYDGNSAGTWGEGNAILVGSDPTNLVVGFVAGTSSNIVFTHSIFVGPVTMTTADGNGGVLLQFGASVSNGPAATDTYIEQTNSDGSAIMYNGNPWFLGASSGFSLAYEMITNSLGTNMYVIEAGSPPSPTNTVLFYTQSD
jgi:hypothetical protein